MPFCIGSKLAEDRGLKVGDRMPLKEGGFPCNLNLTIRGIYDGPHTRDRRMCLFQWDYLEETLKRDFPGRPWGNAGMVVVKCKSADAMPALCKKIDLEYKNSDKFRNLGVYGESDDITGGMGLDGVGEIDKFVKAGGVLVTLGTASYFPAEFGLAPRQVWKGGVPIG